MPSRPLRPLPLVLLALACAAGTVLVYALLVRTHAGQRVDDAALNGRLASYHARHAASELLTTISVGSLALGIAVLVGQALVRRRVMLAVAAVAVVVGALLVTEVLKHLVLVRPNLLPYRPSIDANSLPSGHTTTAFAVGIAATLAAPPRWRRAVAAVAFAYGTAIGVATIAAGWHRPSDVAAAMLVVIGWAAVVALAVAFVDPGAFGGARGGDGGAGDRSSWARRFDLGAYAALAVAALALGWVAAVAIVAGRRAGTIELTTLNAAFVAACACVAALAAVLVAALLAALQAALPATAPSPVGRGGGPAA